MAFNQSEPAIAVEEHDNTFGVKKVSPFLDSGNNTLVRQIANGFSIGTYDYVSLTQASTTDAYAFKTGGASGTLLATITITFTDATKATISTVVRT